MKKIIFVVVLMLVASACFAQLQSGPSNVVGYVKIVAVANPDPGIQTISTPFGLPFKFWDVPVGGIPTYGDVSTYPSDICGDQLNPGGPTAADRILRQDNGQSAYRSATLVWTGALETNAGMGPGRAFLYQNRTDANRNFVLAGEVDNTGNYLTVSITNLAYVPYGWRDSRSLNRDDLNLLASGFTGGTITTSDRVVAQIGGASFWRRTSDNTWQGTLVTVEPGQGYLIHNRNHANGTWNYNYDASGASLAIQPGTKDLDSGVISKVAPKVKPQAGSKAVRD